MRQDLKFLWLIAFADNWTIRSFFIEFMVFMDTLSSEAEVEGLEWESIQSAWANLCVRYYA